MTGNNIFFNAYLQLLLYWFIICFQGLTKNVFPEQATSYSVVSNGAECILISKKFFFEKANEATLHHLRQVVS